MKTAVVLFNLGGPDSPAAVLPFLRNLFRDPAILRMPGFARILLAEFIARRYPGAFKLLLADEVHQIAVVLLRNAQGDHMRTRLRLGRVFDVHGWASEAQNRDRGGLGRQVGPAFGVQVETTVSPAEGDVILPRIDIRKQPTRIFFAPIDGFGVGRHEDVGMYAVGGKVDRHPGIGRRVIAIDRNQAQHECGRTKTEVS